MNFKKLLTLCKRLNIIKTFNICRKVESQVKNPILIYKKTGFRIDKDASVIVRKGGKLEVGKVWGREPKIFLMCLLVQIARWRSLVI